MARGGEQGVFLGALGAELAALAEGDAARGEDDGGDEGERDGVGRGQELSKAAGSLLAYP